MDHEESLKTVNEGIESANQEGYEGKVSLIGAGIFGAAYASILIGSALSKAQCTPEAINFVNMIGIWGTLGGLGNGIKNKVVSKYRLAFFRALSNALKECPTASIPGLSKTFIDSVPEYCRVYRRSTKKNQMNEQEAIDKLNIISYDGRE